MAASSPAVAATMPALGDRRLVRAGVAAPQPFRLHALPRPIHPSLGLGAAVLAVGAALHFASLALVERVVVAFPSVTDAFQARLPYVDFGVAGELVFVAFLVACAATLLREQPRSVPSVLCLLGGFYAIRGVFLFLLPIGSPPTAPALADRFVLYPFPSHAYFPGGHAALMTIMSLAIHARRRRRVMLTVTALFALGTIVSRTHYTADAIGGALVGYALVSWGRRHLAFVAPAARGGAPAYRSDTVRTVAIASPARARTK